MSMKRRKRRGDSVCHLVGYGSARGLPVEQRRPGSSRGSHEAVAGHLVGQVRHAQPESIHAAQAAPEGFDGIGQARVAEKRQGYK